MPLENRLERLEDLLHRLMELGLAGIFRFYVREN